MSARWASSVAYSPATETRATLAPVSRGAGQRARARGLALAVRAAAAPGQQALDLGQHRVAQAVLAVDGDHDVAGPRVGAGAQRRQGAEVGRRPHDDLARRHAVALAQGARDAHEPHAVGVAVRERADLPAHAATGADAKTDGPSSSGTIQVPWCPRTAVARCAASAITALPPAAHEARGALDLGPHAARRELALLEVAQRIGDA